MFSEVVLSCSNTDSTSYLWDVRSGTVVFSLKQNMAPKNGVARAPLPWSPARTGLVFSAQTDKAIINAYSWQKDQVHSKSLCPEKISTVAVSKQGVYCAGGTQGGKIYIWEISTGVLYRSFDAHYKKITALRFTDDDTALISASDDASVNVWLLTKLLDEQEDITVAPSPHYSWSDHSLPVTDIVCGTGTYGSARIWTSSLDHTVKLWDLATGSLLTTFLFPHPIDTLAVDVSETTLLAAGHHNIYQVDLYKRVEERSYAAASVESLGGMGKVESVGLDSSSNARIFKGHTDIINSLSFSFDGSLLISGSQDGDCIVWDVPSRQALRKFSQHKGPVTSVTCFIKPPELTTAFVGQQRSMESVMPITPFKRTRRTEDEEREHGLNMIIPNTTQDLMEFDSKFDGRSTQYLAPEIQHIQQTNEFVGQVQTEDSSTSLRTQVNKLQSELVRVHDHYNKVKSLHNEMYTNLVDQFMADRRKNNN
ncbi:hypothetical protein NQZ79_g3661 [Umbelopsis isabellina]|nr:hypothetical protein NQZ79_g3661 [Umbelopsis isabellina]